MHTLTNTLRIDHCNLAAPLKEVAELNWFDQGPLWDGQRDIMLKSTLPERKLRLGYYPYCDLKHYGNLSIAASFLRDIKDWGLQICVFFYDENTLR